MKALAVVLILLGVVEVMVEPLILIWILNALGLTTLSYTFETWFVALVALVLLRVVTGSTIKWK